MPRFQLYSLLATIGLLATTGLIFSLPVFAQNPAPLGCPETSLGAAIESPKEIHSRNGRLQIEFRLRNSLDSTGQMQYCYVDELGDRSPTLRVRPGDLLQLTLKNEISLPSVAQHSHESGSIRTPKGASDRTSGCTSSQASSLMTIGATNLHFHGLSISPSCHADDSLHTSIAPSSQAFLYRFRIPRNQPPGLYWYHPHVHGHSEEQVLGGASGALIVEGIAQANPAAAGLPERVMVVRDRNLESSVAPPSRQNPVQDASVPAKDLSLNFVRIPYPKYSAGTIATAPAQREFWRVLNASADTYVDLAVLFNGEWQGGSGLVAAHGKWQSLGLVAVDGVPITKKNSLTGDVLWRTDIPIPPGGRAEFIVQTPPEGVKALLFTAGAETTLPQDEDNPAPVSNSSDTMLDNDEFTPPRPLAQIVSSSSAVEPRALKEELSPPNPHARGALASASPLRRRKLYFSEKVMDPKKPQTSTVFYLTEEGHIPKAFDPSNAVPDIVVHQGDVEDWTIENRSRESHAFHIHQIHFLVLERNGSAIEDRYFADTVDVPYWDGSSSEFPSVTLRMDFRNPNVVGTFPYHCHILQHADQGMMGLIQVRSQVRGAGARANTAKRTERK